MAGKQREMGLGSFPIVTLAAAREKARAFRDQVAQGTDPIASRQALVSATAADRSAQKTFVEVAAQYIEQHSVLEKPKARFAVDSHPVNLRPSVDRRAVDFGQLAHPGELIELVALDQSLGVLIGQDALSGALQPLLDIFLRTDPSGLCPHQGEGPAERVGKTADKGVAAVGRGVEKTGEVIQGAATGN